MVSWMEHYHSSYPICTAFFVACHDELHAQHIQKSWVSLALQPADAFARCVSTWQTQTRATACITFIPTLQVHSE